MFSLQNNLSKKNFFRSNNPTFPFTVVVVAASRRSRITMNSKTS